MRGDAARIGPLEWSCPYPHVPLSGTTHHTAYNNPAGDRNPFHSLDISLPLPYRAHVKKGIHHNPIITTPTHDTPQTRNLTVPPHTPQPATAAADPRRG